MNKPFLLLSSLIALLPCLAFGQAMSSPTPAEATGIEGNISIAPVHGGPVREGEPASAPLAHMAFVVKQGDRVIKSFETDDQGHFRVLLEPGHYTVARQDLKSAVGSYGPFEVDVSAGKMTSVNWNCDSGMR